MALDGNHTAGTGDHVGDHILIDKFLSPLAPPVWAGAGRTKKFDATRSIYNYESYNLGLIRARVANGSLNGGGKCQIIAEGHSYMAGSQATPGVSDTLSTLRKIIGAKTGATARFGISPFRNGENRDSHYSSIGSGWTASNGLPIALYATSTTNGDALTYTSTEAGTIVTIYVTGDSTDFTYSIDGGTAVPVTTGDGTLAVRRIVVSGLANTTHTVTIAKTATGSTRFIGAGVTDTTGLEIFNFGYGGAMTYQWISVTSGEHRAVATSCATQRDVILIELDTNDARPLGYNQTGTQWKNSIGQIITSHISLGHPTALILSVNAPDSNSAQPIPTGRWDEYGQAAYELAEQYDIPLLDTRHLLNSWAGATTSTFIAGDALHLNSRGYYQMSQGIAGLLVR